MRSDGSGRAAPMQDRGSRAGGVGTADERNAREKAIYANRLASVLVRATTDCRTSGPRSGRGRARCEASLCPVWHLEAESALAGIIGRWRAPGVDGVDDLRGIDALEVDAGYAEVLPAPASTGTRCTTEAVATRQRRSQSWESRTAAWRRVGYAISSSARSSGRLAIGEWLPGSSTASTPRRSRATRRE